MAIKFHRQLASSLGWGVLGLLILLNAGCADRSMRGQIFTWVTVPLTLDLHNTPSDGNADISGRMIHIKEPFSGYGFYTEIDSNGIGDIARKHNLRIIYFADIEIFNIMGIWKTETVHVYGE